MPRVSILIPCYRQAQYLGQAVDDALGQTHGDVETIVINDGSDDDTAEVAARYKGRIRYLHQPNRGPSAARNFGIREASGEWVLFLDADDRLDRETIARCVQAVGNDVGVVGVLGHRYFRERIEESDSPLAFPGEAASLRSFVWRTSAPINAYFAPLTAVRAVGGFDEEVLGAEDLDLWIRLAEHGLHYCPIRFLGPWIRRAPGTTSISRDRLRMAKSGARVVSRYASQHLEASWFGEVAGDVLRYLYAFRRKLRIIGQEPQVQQQLTDAIQRLRSRGFRVRAALPIRIQDMAPPWLGDCIERLGLAYYATFRPSFYNEL
jgi:glycosyltransferase involved in cell wall biosynthesis